MKGLNDSGLLPFNVEFKEVVTTADSIHQLALDANNSKECAGVITWMHTFSPAKSWIAGLKALQTPVLHFHTQYNRDIPWDSIDMDLMTDIEVVVIDQDLNLRQFKNELKWNEAIFRK